ncbi:MAG TPA: peptide ABC transporter substrate-binding protein [Opitutaceae bacterium]|nr:peptide ABC transporter substrate-binding protein [Opitutaceae bacterium]
MRPLARCALAVALLSIALAVAGCAPRETLVARGDREQVLHRGVGYEVADLDPQLVTGLGEMKIVAALFEGLVGQDARDGRPVPAVAESWEVSPDALTFTFHLRAGARWSDGAPLTAQDFVDSWRRILTPSLAADNAPMLFVLRGAEAFHKNPAGDFSTVGAQASDARTLRVTLAQPTPYFLALLANAAWMPVPLRAIAAQGDAFRRGNAWTRRGPLVGNGPFVLREWSPNRQIVVEKSPTYWDAASVRLHAIHFYPIDNDDAEERAFRAGQLHVTEILPVSKVDAYRREQPALLRIDPYLDTFFLRFNVRRAPLDDERVRRALSLALDRAALAQKVLHAGQQPAATLVPPGLGGYVAPARPLSDVAAARRLLAAAGYSAAHPLPALELMLPNSGVLRLVAEAAQEMWRRDLGVDVRLLNQEKKTIFAERRAGNYQILLYDWIGDYPDPTTFLDLWRSDSGNNHTAWSSRDYDALLDTAARTAEPAARLALLQRAEALLLDAAPIAPLYFNTHAYLLQPSVKNWHPSPLDQLDYKHVWLEP